ncbi:MAG: hypothetical protein AAF823_11430 [Planctomycetota bacterium]
MWFLLLGLVATPFLIVFAGSWWFLLTLPAMPVVGACVGFAYPRCVGALVDRTDVGGIPMTDWLARTILGLVRLIAKGFD